MYTKEQAAEWRRNNPDKIRAYENKATARAKELILDLIGRKCAHCNIDDIRVLQIDHINGDGAEMRKSGVRGTRALLAYMRRNGTAEFQILCANCNWIKRHTNGEANYAF